MAITTTLSLMLKKRASASTIRLSEWHHKTEHPTFEYMADHAQWTFENNGTTLRLALPVSPSLGSDRKPFELVIHSPRYLGGMFEVRSGVGNCVSYEFNHSCMSSTPVTMSGMKLDSTMIVEREFRVAGESVRLSFELGLNYLPSERVYTAFPKQVVVSLFNKMGTMLRSRILENPFFESSEVSNSGSVSDEGMLLDSSTAFMGGEQTDGSFSSVSVPTSDSKSLNSMTLSYLGGSTALENARLSTTEESGVEDDMESVVVRASRVTSSLVSSEISVSSKLSSAQNIAIPGFMRPLHRQTSARAGLLSHSVDPAHGHDPKAVKPRISKAQRRRIDRLSMPTEASFRQIKEKVPPSTVTPFLGPSQMGAKSFHIQSREVAKL